MEDRKRVRALGLMCVAAMACARPAAANPAPFLQVAPLVYDGVIAHDLRAQPASPVHPSVAISPARRPAALIPLYGAFTALQAADAHSTTLTLRHGGTELNPLMGGVAGSPKGLMAVKLATTAITIAATEMLWRGHPRAAVIAMTIITSGYGVVVGHNYGQLHRGSP
jgi:Domain of unknown function (DUF5658)